MTKNNQKTNKAPAAAAKPAKSDDNSKKGNVGPKKKK